jgi:hypothetical protein
MTSSAVRAISLMRWPETKTVRPSDARRRSNRRAHRGRLTGSSNSSTPGSPGATAMPGRWLTPRENLPAGGARRILARRTRAPHRRGCGGCRSSGPASKVAPRQGVLDGSPSPPAARQPRGAAIGGRGRDGRSRWPPSVRVVEALIIRIVVDFPAPFGPSSPSTLPAGMQKLTRPARSSRSNS